jgi:hypothetical protein
VKWDLFVAALEDTERQLLQVVLAAHMAQCGLTPEEMVMATRGRTVDAIKSVKNRLSIGRREARDMVYAFQRKGA